VPLDDADVAADVLIGLRQAGVPIASISVAKPSLDEVFLAITGQPEEEDEAVHDDAVHDETAHDEAALEVMR
jgi:ABC-2 type transport system ATP-binding protein